MRIKHLVIRQLHEPQWKLVELWESERCYVCDQESYLVWINGSVVVCPECEEQKDYVKDEGGDSDSCERETLKVNCLRPGAGRMMPRSRIGNSSIKHIVLVQFHEPRWKLVELYGAEECFICGRLSTFVWLNNPVVVCPECEEEKNFRQGRRREGVTT
jgi:hypothetical protein